MEFFYLHGWASSPDSKKAVSFKQHFIQQGIELHIPDLNQDDFFHLTLSRQIQQLQVLLPKQPVTLIGSSFGGLTALWLAEKELQIERLILMAPALNFTTHGLSLFSEAEHQRWREAGEFLVHHHAYQREMPLSYAFIEDLQHYNDAHLKRQIPTLILHGIHDEVIPIQASREFVAIRPWIEMIELNSDHSLEGVHSQLLQATQDFCALPPPLLGVMS